MIGKVLASRYRIDSKLATGGMATVYKAFDLTLERPVAIKIIQDSVMSETGQLERFRREALAVAKLSHPNIVPVIDSGNEAGKPYIVFEYVEGETLKQLLKRKGKLPITEAVAYTLGIARGLAASHRAHIIHRDVKPQNVLIGSDNTIKITDFGIARRHDESELTQTGRVIGTTDYVSPEQALGKEVNSQSDIYSLGILLYELLTGSVPFRGDNPVAIAMQHVNSKLPDIKLLRPDISAALAAVIDHATAKDVSLRYGHIELLITDLEDVLTLEGARHSGVTEENKTLVLNALPASKQERLPLRSKLTHPTLLGSGLALIAILIVVGFAVLISRHAHRGTGATEKVPAGLSTVSLKQHAAHDFDPAGDGKEHPREVSLLLDRNPKTAWSSEHYDSTTLDKSGFGIYLDAAPSTKAKIFEINTRTPGFKGRIYAAKTLPDTAPPNGWTKISNRFRSDNLSRIKLLASSTRFRYYLLWVTDLPPQQSVELTEVSLLR